MVPFSMKLSGPTAPPAEAAGPPISARAATKAKARPLRPQTERAISAPSRSTRTYATPVTDPSRRAKEFATESETHATRRRQRALRQPKARAAGVVLARRAVVRAARIEERRQHLDVPSADTELELPAAVHLNAPRGTVLDALEQPRRRAEPRRLDVQPSRFDRKRAHVGDGVNRRVEAEPALLALQHRSALSVE